jgi:hypothetical protein
MGRRPPGIGYVEGSCLELGIRFAKATYWVAKKAAEAAQDVVT